MQIPYEPIISGKNINIHLILEYLAFFFAFRYYVYLRKNTEDHITKANRMSIILGAVIGAFLGSRIVGYFENPVLEFSLTTIVQLFNVKTIMGGLFGGLIGVEISKKIIGEKHSSGDLFTMPIILGIFIGRIGCFLSGTNEFTYGSETASAFGMDLGDGLLRHPVALYELFFLVLLFVMLKQIKKLKALKNGTLFKIFMLSYFGFRFMIEFIKPNTFFILGLSSIQWLSILCYLYYYKTIINSYKNAR